VQQATLFETNLMCLNVSANFKIKVLIDAVLSLCGLQLSWLL